MCKKILKILVVVASVAAFVVGIVYFIHSKKKTDDVAMEEDNFDTKEEHLDAMDALDLSSLKFSRHYVDLR